jgi:hypothetical protein
MTTVTQGTTGTYTFAANEMVTLALTGSQQARVEVIDAVTGKVKYGATTSVSETFGPFNVSDALSVTAVRGSVVYTISTYTPPSTGGGGSWGSITGTLGSQTDLAAALASALKAPTNWAASAGGGTPTLTSGTAVLGTAYKNTTAGTTNLSPAIDGISQVSLNDILICFTAGTYTYLPAGGGYLGSFATAAALQTAYPAASNSGCSALVNGVIYTSNGTTWLTKAAIPTAISTGTTLSDAHDCANLVCTSTPALTLNTGLKNGFGCSIKGAFTTAGTATVTDLRTTNGTAFCCLVQSDTAGTGLTYDLVGTK